jgi:hypothetical protein
VSDSVVDYICLFLEKAAEQRRNLTGLNVGLKAEKGWLAERWHPDIEKIKRPKPAPFTQYKGDPHDAFWYFDKEMAEATENYYAVSRGKKEQYIGFIQNNVLLPFDENLHARITGNFNPESDGLTFHLSAVFTDTLRQVTRGHETREQPTRGQAPLLVDRICGPVEKVNDSTFTVRFYRMGLNNTRRTGDIWLIAHHEGDKEYKSAVQQINIRIPYPNTNGKEQHITFPALENVDEHVKSIQLNAISDSGLPVYYYVKEGPAEITGNQLVFTKIPPRTKYPVKVTVVAWQYGRSAEPAIQTAEPVTQSFEIHR